MSRVRAAVLSDGPNDGRDVPAAAAVEFSNLVPLRTEIPARRAAQLRGDRAKDDDWSAWTAAVEDTARALRAPIDLLRPQLLTGEDTISDQAAETYVMCMISALLAILPPFPMAKWQEAAAKFVTLDSADDDDST